MQIDADPQNDFAGAKLALYLGGELAVILRDDVPGLEYPGYWDLPGGGRENDETPVACALRECREELGLCVPLKRIVWARPFSESEGTKWFFVAEMPAAAVDDIRFGDEGQRWALMGDREYLGHPKAIPAFQERLKLWLELRGSAD